MSMSVIPLFGISTTGWDIRATSGDALTVFKPFGGKNRSATTALDVNFVQIFVWAAQKNNKYLGCHPKSQIGRCTQPTAERKFLPRFAGTKYFQLRPIPWLPCDAAGGSTSSPPRHTAASTKLVESVPRIQSTDTVSSNLSPHPPHISLWSPLQTPLAVVFEFKLN